MHRQFLSYTINSKSQPCQDLTRPTVEISERLRALRGKNRAYLVRGEDGQHYVQKLPNTNALFNEAYGTELSQALNLSFPDWTELTENRQQCPSLRSTTISSFGSALLSGELWEYVPGAWYQNVVNRSESYRCLLFDLWCNNTDARGAIFQLITPQRLSVHFFDNDALFSKEQGKSIPQRISQCRYLDLRLYQDPQRSVHEDLCLFAQRIRTLVEGGLEGLLSRVPETWGCASHRQRVIHDLERRSHYLEAYIREVDQFAVQANARTSRSILN